MPYSKLYYHLIWSTRGREPIIPADIESEFHGLIVGAAERHGVKVLAIGGVSNHVHLVVSISPSMSVAKAIGLIKGASSKLIGERLAGTTGDDFGWQPEYGAVTFSESHMDAVCRYVRNQRERHGQHRLVPGLEHDGDPTMKPVNSQL